VTSRRWLPPALWAALILVLTSIPAPPDLTAGIPLLHLDKVVHFLLYAGQGWLVTRALRTRRPRSLLAALLGIAVFGAFDEWHQHLFARTPSLVDWIADVIGASVGVAFASRVHRVETAQ
jgi:VanZ family protein